MADGSPAPPLGFVPGPATARAFRDAPGSFAKGVTLVTIDGDAGAMGFAADSFASLSLDPPLVLWALARASRRFPGHVAARHHAIHVLPLATRGLLERFLRGGPGFDGLAFGRNAQGVPELDAAPARFDCRQSAVHDGGDHAIIVGQVLTVGHRDGDGLLFHRGRYGSFTPQA